MGLAYAPVPFPLTLAKNISSSALLRVPALLLRLLLCAAVLATAGASDAPLPHCSGVVNAVVFEGNKVTRDSTLRQFISLQQGEACSPEKLSASRQGIMNSGLFRTVNARFDDTEGVAVFTVRERHYSLPIPRFDRTSDGELRVGGQLRMDNVFGLNHRFKITARREAADDGRGNAGNRITTSYQIPRLLNSDFGFQVALSAVDKTESLITDGMETGLVQKRQGFVGFDLTRFFSRSSSLAGWRTRLGLGLLARDYDLRAGEIGSLVSGEVVQLRFAAEYRDVQEGEFRRVGRQFGIALSGSHDELLSDYSFARLDAYYQAYIPLPGENYQNINLRVKIGAADRGPFGEQSYSLGGSDTTRGFSAGTQVGQKMLLLNAEYLRAFETLPTLRWSVFMDMGVIKGDESFKLGDVKTGLGAGIRWKIRSFVNTDLRLDVAWGLGEKGDSGAQYYFGTNVVF